MIAKLQNPIAFTTISLVLSIGVGVTMSWRVLSRIVTQAAAARPANKAPTELKSKGWDFWTIEIENLANELKEERARLKKQTELLEQRAMRLAAEEKEFAKIRADVEAMRKQVSDRVIEITADESKNIRTLAATYTSLTPRGAVAILREMDEGTAVKILSVMKPDAVGPIFEEMTRSAGSDPQLARRAAALSEKLRLMKSTKSTPPS
jgi:flagellar motility protein MotE (MotC chaperone)